MRDVGKNIKEIRTARNMTQDQLAEKLFVTRQTVSHYENGKSRPDIDTLVKISDILQTDVSSLIYGVNPSTDRRNRKISAVMVAVTLITGTLCAVLYQYCYTIYNSFDIRHRNQPLIGTEIFVIPLFFTILSWTFMQLLGTFSGLKPLNFKKTKYIRTAVIAVFLFYTLVLCYHFLPGVLMGVLEIFGKSNTALNNFYYNSGNISLKFINSLILMPIYIHGGEIVNIPAAVFGVLFWLCGFPFKGTDSR